MDDMQTLSAFIAQKEHLFTHVASTVWEYAERNWREHKSADILRCTLAAEGFTIEDKPCDMETAFVATYGNTGPVIGFLGEYDALDGLSQKAGVAIKEPAQTTAGHGCGHNLLGAGSLAAAVAMKDYITKTGLAATVKYFACPAEEDGGGKVFFARDGYFKNVDALLTWHPGTTNCVAGQGSLAVMGVLYSFKGRTAHAASAPFAGRSALDAAELMSVGCNYLREHIIPEARLHYAYRDVGGTAPNVVQESACVHYYIRAPKVADMFAIKERVDDVARGAALMTGTTLERKTVDGFSDYVPNDTLSQLLYECMQTVGAPDFDADDLALAETFANTVSAQERAANLESNCATIGENLSFYDGKLLDDTIGRYLYQPRTCEPGSTDVGDASYCAPTAQCNYATATIGTGGHTWQMTAQSNSSIGMKGMLQAAKALALCGVRAAQDPALLAKAKEEYLHSCPNGYTCPAPADAVPQAVE